MSLVSFLSIARSALVAHQYAMQVTSNNVANAQTPGYTRQRLRLAPDVPFSSSVGQIGRGVTVDGILRVRDRFHDTSFRQESGMFGRASTMSDLLGQIEAAMNEPSDSGVTSALDGFFGAFSELANSPSTSANREGVRRTAQRLIDRLHSLDSEVTRGITGAVEQLGAQVKEVNTLSAQIADLNARILASGGPTHSAPDLQDMRDNAVDQLSSLVGVRVTENPDGTITVTSGSAVLVDRGRAATLEVNASGSSYSIGVSGQPGTVDLVSGSLTGLLEMIDTKLPAVRARLDALAQAVVSQVNAVHRTGTTLGGQTNTDFFDPAGVTAAGIRLTGAITASTDAIVTGLTSAAGDGTVAAQIAALANSQIAALGNRTMRDYYVDVATGVGSDSNAAYQDAEAYRALYERSDIARQSVAGVNLDEEMVALVAQQQAYTAAARLVNIASEMMDAVMAMV